ncbi:unnamed protein product [Owenia fusiformis]|uniref:Serine/arginine-rich splicing factor 2 n=1 Tax=Owenia fusiformis TaxID=6347 RepID=A0A8S4PL55_OWEFU|nr:unnamed protein product [Owenia fusiformis]
MSYGRGPPDTSGMFSLKVDNLTYRTTPEELKRHFSKHGEVGDIYIPRDRHTKDSRGFAFVRYYDKRDAEEAMDDLDGFVLDGRELRVQMARYGRPAESGRRGGDRGRDRDRGGYGRRRSRSRSYSPRRRRSRSGSRSRDRRHRSPSRSPQRSRSPYRSPSRSPRSRSRSRS